MYDVTANRPPILRHSHLQRGEAGVGPGGVHDCAVSHPGGLLGLTVAGWSDRTCAIRATVIRLVRSLGFGGQPLFRLPACEWSRRLAAPLSLRSPA